MRSTLSRKTRLNWLIDAGLFLAAIIVSLSGIYFLYFPNGYQGGRNPWYDVRIVFDRAAWSDIHTWGGVLMIVAVAIHLAIHTQWIKTMSKRLLNIRRHGRSPMSRGAKVNIAVNAAIAVTFLLTAISGLYFLFVPGGSARPTVVFSPTTWDLIHTWAGVAMIAAALVHFYIHWGWVTKVTTRFFAAPVPQPGSSRSTMTTQ